ncbi:MAG: SMC-Scp complex subunit ScpB [Methanobacteriota archaeon]|jgi:segregation and condensation protein B|nr:MAG: SMC-Scp complex subunit ScpB [Euryarchaeota archaeon]|tara:strand:+ start:585 stop:1085 length:501 start_codon:yes stop_codon:yes gene_type:complete
MKELIAVEAALFSAGRALDATETAEATGLSRKNALTALDTLFEVYKKRESALEIVKLGHKYALQLKTEAVQYGRRLAPQEIPSYLLRTLALIAHEQPMLQTELKYKLGDKVYEHVGELLELGMVQRERKGRSFELCVTPAFMEYFGINADNQNELKAYLEQALTES